MARRSLVAILFGIFVLLITGARARLDAGSAAERAASSGLAPHYTGEQPAETNTPTNTPVPATNTPTNTPIPATNTPTNTPVPATDTPTNTPTATNTSEPGTDPTNTPIPIETSTPTNTPKPPTATPQATNAPPAIDLGGGGSGTGFEAHYLIGGGAVQIVSKKLSIQADSANLVSATIEIKNLKDGAAEKLTINLFSTNIDVDKSKNGFLLLTGRDTVANYEKVLRTTKYNNTANSPDTTTRRVSFIVNDGQSNSNKPISRVKMVDPSIQIEKEPDLQTIAKGGPAEFSIKITNSGNVQLNNIIVNDPLAPNCNRQLSSLDAGEKETITCSIANVNDEFTNVANVEAVDSFGNEVSDEDSARVEVQNPNIQIVKSPSSQTLLKGEQARFNILVVNTSNAVNLTDVAVNDPLVPSCNKQIDNLGKQEEIIYSCEKTGVTAPFINEITVTGRNTFNNEIVSDSSIAAVEILDLQATLAAEPLLLDLSGGAVSFDVSIVNGGSVPFTLQSLVSDEFGAIDDPDNQNIENSSCFDVQMVELHSSESYACSFTAYVTEVPGVLDFTVTATAKDNDRNIVEDSASASVIVADYSKLAVSVEAIPASLPAPGGMIEERIVISNLTSDKVIVLDVLHHSEIGSLQNRGDCSLPQSLGPEETYSCSISLMASGEIGDFVSHIVSAAGETKAGLTVGNVDQTQIYYFDRAKQQNWLPIVANPETHPEEDNDSPCTAFPLNIGETYQFTLDDKYDWYYFDITRSGKVIVKLDNLMSKDAQAAVYANNSCKMLSDNDLVSYNGDDQSSKRLVFSANVGRHFLIVADAAARTAIMPYTVSVQAPQ